MTVDYEITEDNKRIKITIAPDDCVDTCLLTFFDGATPTFRVDEDGNLTAEIDSALRKVDGQ